MWKRALNVSLTDFVNSSQIFLMDFSSYDLNALHLTHYSFEQQCNGLSLELEEGEMGSPSFLEASSRLLYFSYLLELVSVEIETRRMQSLLFSYEDVFRIVGQYDKYLIVKFYRTSNAYKKYGDEAHGRLIYGKKARKELTETIADEHYLRTDGALFIDGGGKDSEKNEKLKNDGFMASEIYSISTFNDDPNENMYKTSGLKEIPNTITIPFESGELDLARMQNLATSWKFQDGTKILDHELTRYYANEFIIKEGKISDEIKERYLYKSGEKIFKEEAIIQIYSYYYNYNALDEISTKQFNVLLRNRAERRFQILMKDLSVSKGNLERFKKEFPNEYRTVRGVFLTFTDETLTNHKTQHPIYLDEERFVHIYGRHYVNYFEPYSTYKGTNFPYTYKDIRRVICLLLERLQEEIEETLSQGKPYNKYGDKGYYFNVSARRTHLLRLN